MKRTHQCPKCGGADILYALDAMPAVDLEGGAYMGGRLAHQVLRPEVAYHKVGPLEAYCCASCGYVETYLRDIKSVFVDGHFVRRLNPQADTYRG